MSKVILGLPGPWADDCHKAADHYTTTIGGLPDWPFSKESVASGLLECGSCGKKLSLLAQIYAPISSGNTKIEERQICVFGCPRPKCGTSTLSWRALRIQSSHDQREIHNPSSNATVSDSSSALASHKNCWGSLDEEDGEDIDMDELGEALSEAASLASHSRKQNGNKHSETIVKPSFSILNDICTRVLPCFYIFFEEELSTKDVASICSNYSSLSIKEKQNGLDDQVEEEAWEAENYEYDRALTVGRTYLKFKKRLDAKPEQCIRYSYGGKPLLAAAEKGNIGSCGLCGEARHFEVQLMPSILYFLHEATDEKQKEPVHNWDWMTVIVYTCSKNCVPSPAQGTSNIEDWFVAEEAVVVQNEETLQGWDQLGYFS